MSLPPNVRKLYAFAFLKMALFPMAIITLFWKDHIGLTLAEILLLQGIFSLATLLMEYPSGYLSDRLGYRFSLNLASLVGIAGWAQYTAADSFADVLLAEILLGVCYAFISGSDSALLFESLRRHGREEDYARYDGRMSGYAQGGEAAGALFAGLLYAASPLLPFFIQVGVWVAALAICRTLEEAPPEPERRIDSHLREALATCRLALCEDRALRATLLLAAVLGLASFYPVWLIQPYMQESGVPLTWFGPVWAGANLTVALCSLASHRSTFALGLRGMVFLFLALIACGYFGLAFAGGVWGFLCYYLLTAMRGLSGPLLRHRLQQAGTRATRASILSLKSLLFRLLFVVSGPLVGHLADRDGLRPTLLLVGALLLATLLPLAHSFLRQHQD